MSLSPVLTSGVLFRKQANFLSQYLTTGPVQRSLARSSPWSSTIGRTVGANLPLGPLIGFDEMGDSLMSADGGDAEREALMKEEAKRHARRTYGESAEHGFKTGIPAAVLMALVGAGAGAYAGYNNTPLSHYIPGDNSAGWEKALYGGLTGAAAGGGAALISKVLNSMYDRAVLGNVDPRTVSEVSALKSKRRYLSSLPFGDTVLAASMD